PDDLRGDRIIDPANITKAVNRHSQSQQRQPNEYRVNPPGQEQKAERTQHQREHLKKGKYSGGPQADYPRHIQNFSVHKIKFKEWEKRMPLTGGNTNHSH